MPSGGIDYSKWDKLQLSSSEEEEEQEEQQRQSPPPRAVRAGGQTTTPSPDFPPTIFPNSQLSYSKTTPSAIDLEKINAGEEEIICFSTAAEFEHYLTLFEHGNTESGRPLAICMPGQEETVEDHQREETPFRESGEIYGRGDLAGLCLVPAHQRLLIADHSKMMRKNDGSLLYGNLGGDFIPLAAAPRDLSRGLSVCYHGSSEANFRSDSDFQKLVTELVHDTVADYIRKDLEDRDRNLQVEEETSRDPERDMYLQKNMDRLLPKYRHLLRREADAVTLCRHAFAWAGREFLASNGVHGLRVQTALSFAAFLKFVEIPSYRGVDCTANKRRIQKFQGRVMNRRGQIVCLSKYLPCSCFDGLKEVSEQGTKVAPCEGCLNDFAIDELKKCGRCKISRYCSRACSVDDWPMHKMYCKKKE